MATGRVEKRYKDSWTVIIELGYDSEGKRDRIVESIKVETEKEANEYLQDRLYELRHGTFIKPDKITVKEYLDKWLEIRKAKLAPKTYYSYKKEIERHVVPNLGKKRLQQLTPMDLQEYYSKMELEGRIDTAPKKDSRRAKEQEKGKKTTKEKPPGLSQRTIYYHHRILTAALKQAVKWKYIPSNPALYVDAPTFEKKEMSVLCKGELERFLKHIENSEYHNIIYCALMTGMRQGEILGLRWQDIDLDSGLINVRQQLQYVPGEGWFFKAPKSKKSNRAIPMQLPLNKMFREIKKEQTKYRLQEEEKLKNTDNKEFKEEELKAIYDDQNLIFCQWNGTRISGNIVSNRFKELVVSFKRPELRFHDLRHTFAALCISAGMSMEKLQVIMGHESITTTIDMYGHIPIDTLNEEMKKLSQYLGFEAIAK